MRIRAEPTLFDVASDWPPESPTSSQNHHHRLRRFPAPPLVVGGALFAAPRWECPSPIRHKHRPTPNRALTMGDARGSPRPAESNGAGGNRIAKHRRNPAEKAIVLQRAQRKAQRAALRAATCARQNVIQQPDRPRRLSQILQTSHPSPSSPASSPPGPICPPKSGRKLPRPSERRQMGPLDHWRPSAYTFKRFEGVRMPYRDSKTALRALTAAAAS